mgnify:CR=1 FL=1
MASELELAQIDVQLHQVHAAVPAYRVALLTADATLSALLAQQPGQLKLGAVPHLPELKQPVAVVEGENYLRYRADVASSERLLAARTADMVFTAQTTIKEGQDFYPDQSDNFFVGNSFPTCGINFSAQEIMGQTQADQ